jgi:hypothetical protein
MFQISKVSDILSHYFYSDIINIIIKKFNCEFENVKELKTGDYVYKYYKYTRQNEIFIIINSTKCFYKCILVDYNISNFKLEWLDKTKIKKGKDYKKLKYECNKKIKCLSNVYYE